MLAGAYPKGQSVADWLVVLSEDNWEICAREGWLGLGRDGQRRLGRMADGDRVWVYISSARVGRQTPRVRRIRAVARITGPVQHLANPPWAARGKERFAAARPIHVERTLDLSGDLLPTLSFAQPTGPWGLRLLNAPVPLTASDLRRLEVAARE